MDLTFPLAASAPFTDDYHAGRGGGSRAHRGIDLFPPAGTPVHAAVGGTISWMPGRHQTAGFALHVRAADGLLYAYYHLGPHGGTRGQAYAAGLSEGQRVSRGQIIGYVGDSGNAAGGRPHLHFEIHDDGIRDPYGTNRLNPYPSLVAAQQRGDFPGRGGSPSRGGSRDGLLRLGDRGAAVSDWQTQLNRVRPSPIAVDGAFGPQTDRATRALQQAAGIAVDGVVGAQTRAALSARAPSVSGLLRQGDRGPPVRDWQSQLNGVLPSSVLVDGIFGPQTDRGTRDFQRRARIAVDGVVGPRTRAALAR